MHPVVVDFETTGLLKPDTMDPYLQPGIIQAGIITCELDDKGRLKPIKSICQLLNPEIPVWDPDAIATHGINPEDVRAAPTFIEFFSELSNLFLGTDCWVGFNVPFDKGVLMFQLQKYGKAFNFPWPPRDLDVMKVAQTHLNIKGKKDTKPPSLIELYRFLFAEVYEGAHDALSDSLATQRCLNKMIEQERVTL